MPGPSGIELFGLVSGILSTIALLAGAFNMNLPSVRIKELDATLEETENLFRDAQEQGLLMDAIFVERTLEKLQSLRNSTVVLRGKAHSATTTLQQGVEMTKGLSIKISLLCGEVKSVRAKISSTTAEAKARLQQSVTTSSADADISNEPIASSTNVSHDSVPNPIIAGVTDGCIILSANARVIEGGDERWTPVRTCSLSSDTTSATLCSQSSSDVSSQRLEVISLSTDKAGELDIGACDVLSLGS
ncbi:hypothetical protein EW146_g7037 [Bondarzewia mesenterica]|uniref:Uncharacterized protein n=1 Tax=Bondarzewia mesenterica TaxID=1095465 RepID=A0A4S4LLW6_9AGAM|nr:hypothetical protein EW146_g7037 [Bondarzewia mesenterica]